MRALHLLLLVFMPAVALSQGSFQPSGESNTLTIDINDWQRAVNFVISNPHGSVQVIPTTGEQIKVVTMHESNPKGRSAEVLVESNRLTSTRIIRSQSGNFQNKIDFLVQVPSQILGDLTITTANDPIFVEGDFEKPINGSRNLKLSNRAGQIECSGHCLGRNSQVSLSIERINSLFLINLNADKLIARSRNGEIYSKNGKGNFDLRANYGDVTINGHKEGAVNIYTERGRSLLTDLGPEVRYSAEVISGRTEINRNNGEPLHIVDQYTDLFAGRIIRTGELSCRWLFKAL